MRIYLVAESGGRTAFKISTAHVYSSLNPVIEDALEKYALGCAVRSEITTAKEYLAKFYTYRKPNMYYAKLDDGVSKAKKVRDEMWEEILDKFIKENPELIKEADRRRK